jgi:prepilin peptidase CpaA
VISYLPHILMLAIVLVAAVTDTRTGLIPNWLTLPAIVVGPVYHLIFFSPTLALQSVLAIVVVALVPFMMYRSGSMGGGDLKLFAALGGLGGLTLGLESLLYSMMAASVVALLTMAFRGQLTVVLLNVWRILSNPFIPKKLRKGLQRNEMHQLRLGSSILIGTCFALGSQYAII